jgi:hypothetical protein
LLASLAQEPLTRRLQHRKPSLGTAVVPAAKAGATKRVMREATNKGWNCFNLISADSANDYTDNYAEGYIKDNRGLHQGQFEDYTKLAYVRRAPQAASSVGFYSHFTSTSCQFLIDRF